VGALQLAQKLYADGERQSSVIIKEAKKLINTNSYTDIEYIKICDTATLDDVDEINDEAVIALAVKVGKTRLIDNSVFGEELKA
jgi:Panthothenate synthetase